jgi:hypothetical protein
MQEEMDRVPILYGYDNSQQEGWIFLDSSKTTMSVICSHCQNEMAYACCPECDLFTNFLANNDERRPKSWTCLECNKEHMLSPDFYENPVRLHFEDDLPDDIKSRYENQTNRQLVFLLIALVLVIVLITGELLF